MNLARLQQCFAKNTKCRFEGHSMKHFLITTVEEFDDDRGGPASRINKVINRKCMREGCDHKETEVIQS